MSYFTFSRQCLFAVLATASCIACSSGSDSSTGPTCLPAQADVIANVHDLYSYPDDRYGIQASESNGAISVTGNQDKGTYAGVTVAFKPCADVSSYAGMSFRVSGLSSKFFAPIFIAGTVADTLPLVGGACKESDPSKCRTPYVQLATTDATLSWHGRWGDFAGGAPDNRIYDPAVTRFTWAFDALDSTPVNMTIDELEFF